MRQQLVSRIEDQGKLGRIARYDPDPHIRIIALLRLRDRALLKEIGCRDTDETVRVVASLCASRFEVD